MTGRQRSLGGRGRVGVGTLVVVVAGVLLAGCGTNSAGVSSKASASLAPYVRAVRVTAASGDRDKLEAGVKALVHETGKLQDRGELSESVTARIDDAAAAVLQAAPSPQATTPTDTPDTTPDTTAPAPTTPTAPQTTVTDTEPPPTPSTPPDTPTGPTTPTGPAQSPVGGTGD